MSAPLPATAPGRDLRTLIVDDSALFRVLLREALDAVRGVEVVGHAVDGEDALAKIDELRPDVVTLDVQMPNLDGLGVLDALENRPEAPVVLMVSNYTSRSAEVTTRALLAGAHDFVLKPSGRDQQNNIAKLRLELSSKLRQIRSLLDDEPTETGPAPAAAVAVAEPSGGDYDAVLVGASTGGPRALATLIPALPADFPLPVLVVQHMPPVYTSSLAQRLDEASPLDVAEAADGDAAVAGRVLLAPGGRHMVLERHGGELIVALRDDPPVHGCRPSVDVLFRSAIGALHGKVIATVLTGMGQDGAAASAALAERGAHVIAQAKAGCTVFGMPAAVIAAGAANDVLPLDGIAPRIRDTAR